MTIARRKSNYVSEENSDESVQPMNVNINIACSIDPKTGASRCRILYPNPVSEMEDTLGDIIEAERKRDLESEEHQNVKAEQEDNERFHRRALKKHDMEEERGADLDDDLDKENSKDYDGEVDPVDDPENSEDDVVPERVTRSTMKKR